MPKTDAQGKTNLSLGMLQDLIKQRQASHLCWKEHGVKFPGDDDPEFANKMAAEDRKHGLFGITNPGDKKENEEYMKKKYSHGINVLV